MKVTKIKGNQLYAGRCLLLGGQQTKIAARQLGLKVSRLGGLKIRSPTAILKGGTIADRIENSTISVIGQPMLGGERTLEQAIRGERGTSGPLRHTEHPTISSPEVKRYLPPPQPQPIYLPAPANYSICPNPNTYRINEIDRYDKLNFTDILKELDRAKNIRKMEEYDDALRWAAIERRKSSPKPRKRRKTVKKRRTTRKKTTKRRKSRRKSRRK